MRVKDEVAIKVRKAVAELILALNEAGRHNIAVSVEFHPTDALPFKNDPTRGIGRNWECDLTIYHREDL